MFVIDAIDRTAEAEGLWFEFLGGEFKIASTSTSAYQKRIAKLYQPHRRKIETNSLDPDVGRDLIARALAGTILTDWKGVSTKDGEEVEYSKDTAYDALFQNEDLRDFVLETGAEIANFRNEVIEDIAGE